jgi:hypothetical protein
MCDVTDAKVDGDRAVRFLFFCTKWYCDTDSRFTLGAQSGSSSLPRADGLPTIYSNAILKQNIMDFVVMNIGNTVTKLVN